MKKYKGYFIDGVIFTCKEDIDRRIKAQLIQRVETLYYCLGLNRDEDYKMRVCAQLDDVTRALVNQFGLTWDEVEKIEGKAISAAFTERSVAYA